MCCYVNYYSRTIKSSESEIRSSSFIGSEGTIPQSPCSLWTNYRSVPSYCIEFKCKYFAFVILLIYMDLSIKFIISVTTLKHTRPYMGMPNGYLVRYFLSLPEHVKVSSRQPSSAAMRQRTTVKWYPVDCHVVFDRENDHCRISGCVRWWSGAKHTRASFCTIY
jgi:hypothetical protein